MRSLYLKEITGFFSTLTGYIVIILFLLANSLFLWVFPGEFNIPDGGYSTLSPFFLIAPWVFLFLIPAVTMRMFAEEKKTGTLEVLLSFPLSHFKLVFSKYLAALTLVFMAIVPSLIYYLSVYILGFPTGNIDTGGTWGSFIGLFFLSAIYTSVGIFASVLSVNIIVSFIAALVLCFFLYAGFDSIALIPSFKELSAFLIKLGINEHYQSISRGVIDTRDVVYYIALIAIFLMVSTYILKRGSNKKSDRKDVIKLFLKVFITILASVILTFSFFRIDLTSEKRYTLSKTSKEILKKLDDVVFVKVYLAGDLNIPFKKMQRSIRELLDEFRIYAGNSIEYEFIDPMAEKDPEIRNDVFKELYNKGLKPSNIIEKENEGKTSEKIVFPGALIVYRSIEVAVNLLKNNPGLSGDENINNSVQTFEYELISKINSLTSHVTEKVAFIEGHGELDEFQTGDITRELSNFFQVDRGRINGQPGILDAYKAVIIAQPAAKFNEADKYVIDQYIMNGGRVLWFIDAVNASLDSMIGNSTIAVINELNIDDLLFRYGIRINPVLVKDMQCNYIPVNMAMAGSPAKFVPSPWPYYVLLSGPDSNPVTRNINMTEARFASSIDTLGARTAVKKIVLLKSSQYSTQIKVPVLISLEEVKETGNVQDYNSQGYPIAVILEGKFESAFKNRIPVDIKTAELPAYKAQSPVNKMLIVADGDLIRNETRSAPNGTMVLPLGLDKYTGQLFGNKDFIINAVNYLTDQTGLISLRSKEIKLRLLDRNRLNKERLKWQLINVVLPVVLVILSGIVYNLYRKRKYGYII